MGRNRTSVVRNGTVQKSVGEFLQALHTDYSSVSTRVPEILDRTFGRGLRIPNHGEEEAVGGQGWYHSKEHW